MNQKIKIEDYHYELPDDRIAKYPLNKRDMSKLLVYRNNAFSNHAFKDIVSIVPNDGLLIFNDTKVIKARLLFQKETGAKIEVFCLEPHEPRDYSLIFESTRPVRWNCIVGNLKKWKSGILKKTVQIDGQKITIEAKRIISGEAEIIEFAWDHPDVTFGSIIEQTGQTPIPPYLNRKSEAIDTQRYQTVYSNYKGSVAAPTAGLHFTKPLLNRLKEKGVKTDNVTLHVGAGTFQPVKHDYIDEHKMHTEHFIINIHTLKHLIDHKGPVIAVGTTSLRTLESLYWLGVKIHNKQINGSEYIHIPQWIAYKQTSALSPKESLDTIVSFMEKNNLYKLVVSTQMIIVPGYRFRVVKGLITNFHQPRSTLLLLVAAFIGQKWKKLYDWALENDYRFLSYGDSSILLP